MYIRSTYFVLADIEPPPPRIPCPSHPHPHPCASVRSQPSTTERRLVAGLQDLKRQMDEENYDKDAFSFTKIILKLGTIEKVLSRVKVNEPLMLLRADPVAPP